MTPEQKQRIEQIRERQVARNTWHPQPESDDIDFLLSLVKSQEATGTARGATAIARDLVCNWRDEWRIPTPEPGPQLDSQSDLIARVAALVNDMQIIAATASDENPRSALSKLHKLQHDAATSMRSACVEKVKETHDSVESACNAALMDVYDLSIANAPMPVKDCREIADCIGDRVGQIRKAIAALTKELESLSIEKPKE